MGKRTPSRIRLNAHRRTKLSLECLEDRLTPSWGSIPPSSIIPPTLFTQVSQNQAGDATGDAGITGNEVDWYRFTATASGTYVFQATTPSSSLDTVAGLYSATGGRIAYNDDISWTNRDSRFSVTLTAGRTYYLGITNYTGTPGGSYAWSLNGPGAVTTPTDDAYEQNDTLSTAYNLGTTTSTTTLNNLVMADGHDWFRFTTSAAGTTSSGVSINFQNAQGDLDLELYNSAGSRLRTSATVNNAESVSLNGLASGTYYVHILGYQGASNPNYSLTITPPISAPPPTGSFDIRLITTGLTVAQQAIFEQAAQRWEGIITSALPAATYNGITTTGVIINASSVAIDGPGGILGQAGPDRFRSGSFLPYHGSMQFDSADVASLQSSGGLLYTVLHEMGHILGIGTIWSNKGLLSGAGTSNPTFIGARATAEYNALFGRAASGVPVENGGGSGTRDSHWRETVFDKELMTGYLDSGVNPISRITIASLADLGYQVDLSRADSYTPPGGGNFISGSGGNGGLPGLRASTNKGLDRAAIVAELLRSIGAPAELLHQSMAVTLKVVDPPAPSAVLPHTAEKMGSAPVTGNHAPPASQLADDLFARVSSLAGEKLWPVVLV